MAFHILELRKLILHYATVWTTEMNWRIISSIHNHFWVFCNWVLLYVNVDTAIKSTLYGNEKENMVQDYGIWLMKMMASLMWYCMILINDSNSNYLACISFCSFNEFISINIEKWLNHGPQDHFFINVLFKNGILYSFDYPL